MNNHIIKQKIIHLMNHRLDHPLTIEKLGLILGNDFALWLTSSDTLFDPSWMNQITQLFLVFSSYFSDQSRYELHLPEFISYDDRRKTIMTSFVTSRMCHLTVDGKTDPCDLFSLPSAEINVSENLLTPDSILLFRRINPGKEKNRGPDPVLIHLVF